MDRHDQIVHLLALAGIKDLSWYLIAREAEKPDGLERLLRGEVTEKSKEATEGRRLLRRSLDALDEFIPRTEEELERAYEAGAEITTVLDEDYPANLRVIYDRPPFLFYRGTLQADDALAVAVVGTRQASPQGLRRARNMSTGLVEEGVTVLSGLARGIDTEAHTAALDRGGRTIAVMGTGILSIYPKENAELAERIVDNGALVSQFWPTAPPAGYNFPRRNRVTSGLGQGTVVIEATRTSGAKMQARLALEHGKLVFLVRSLVTDQEWARKYLDRGAIEVGSIDDVVRELRSPEQVAEFSRRRYQLALDLS